MGEHQEGNGGATAIEQYSPAQYNILAPIVRVDETVPFLRQHEVIIKLDPDTNKGDCYAAPGTRWQKDQRTGQLMPDTVAPAKPALLKIASAMGVIWQTEQIVPESKRDLERLGRSLAPEAVRAMWDEVRYDCAYRARGAVRDGSGWRYFEATYEWNLDAQRRKILREAKKRAEKAAAKGEQFDVEAHVEDRLDQVIAERFGLAESKAILRLVRATGVRQTYTRQEFARPFVVQRVDLDPDKLDPNLRQAFLRKALESGMDLFGRGEEATTVEAKVVQAGGPDFARAEAEGRVETVPPEREAAAPNGETGNPEAGPSGPAPLDRLDDEPTPLEEAGQDAPPGKGPETPSGISTPPDPAGKAQQQCQMCGAVLTAGETDFSNRNAAKLEGMALCGRCVAKRTQKGARR